MNSTYHFYVGSGMYYGGNINIFARAYVDVLTLMLDRYTYLYIDIKIMSISIYISAYISTYLGMTLNCMNLTYLFYVGSSTSMYVLRVKIYIFAHSRVNVISLKYNLYA